MRWVRRFVVLILVAAVGAGVGAIVRHYVFRSSPVPALTSSDPVVVADSGKSAALAPTSVAMSAQPAQEKLEVAGYVIRGGKVRVALTDGRVLAGYDESLGEVMPTYVRVDGRKVYFKQWKPRPLAAVGESADVVRPPAAGPTAPTAHPAEGGAWRTDSDGVQRLVGAQRIGEGYSGSGLR